MTEINIDDLDPDKTDRIISAGLEMITAMAEAFGPEKGQEVWQQFSESLGPAARDAIFMAMLTGRTTGQVRVQGYRDYRNQPGAKYIEFIKTIRQATGFGLKEAKDLADEIDMGIDKLVEIPYKQRDSFVSTLRVLGIKAS